MSIDKLARILVIAINVLSQSESLRILFHQHRDGGSLPFVKVLGEIVRLLRLVVFTGLSGNTVVDVCTLKYSVELDSEIFRRYPSRPMGIGSYGMCRY